MTPATGPRALLGSDKAKHTLALLLEALGGIRTTQEAADAMEVALVRYYQLETRALQAMLEALEPRQKGRKRKSEQDMQAEFAKEVTRLTRDLHRYQSLCRVLQKAVGVKTPKERPKASNDRSGKQTNKAKKGKKTRRVRRTVRGERVVAALTRSTVKEPSPLNQSIETQKE